MKSKVEILANLKKLKSFGIKYVDAINLQSKSNNKVELPNSILNINQNILNCHLCEFSKTRNKIALDTKAKAKLFFVDFRASIVENDTGIVFSGKAGEMLDKIVKNVFGLAKEDVFVSNLVKCYSKRKEITNEAEICKEYTMKQIEMLKPKVLVLFSYESYVAISMDKISTFNDIKGKVIDLCGCKTMVTYSPKTLLRNPSLKKEALSHLKMIKAYL